MRPVEPHVAAPVSLLVVGVRPDEGLHLADRYLAVESLLAHCRPRFGYRLTSRAALVTDRNLDQVADAVLQDPPDILALSLPIGALERGRRLLDRLTWLPSQVVVGNLIATKAPEELLRELPDGAWLVRGEGERPLEVVVERFVGGRRDFPEGVPGLYRLLDGRLVGTPADRDGGDFGGHAEELWPATVDAGGQALVEGSRGCVSNCSFCSSRSLHPGGWRPRPEVDILAELGALHDRGVRSCFFVDDDFVGADWDRATRLAAAIHAGFPDLRFGSSFQAHSFQDAHDQRRLGRLVASGLRSVLIGMESGCDSQLRRYGKASTRSMTRTAVRQLAAFPEVELSLGYFMDPLMTLEELLDSVRFTRDSGLAPYVANPFNTLDVHHGTRYAHRASAQTSMGPLDLNTLTYSCEYVDPRLQDVQVRIDEFRHLTGAAERGVRDEYRRYTRRAVNRVAPQHVGSLRGLLIQMRDLKFAFLARMGDEHARTTPGVGLEAARAWLAHATAVAGASVEGGAP